MNTRKKIIILAVAVIVAVAAVLAFAKTQLDPPRTLEQRNQFVDDVRSSVASLSTNADVKQLDSTFSGVIDKVGFYYKEKKISAGEADKSTDELIEKYTPIFMKYSYDKFKLAVWHDADHNYMLSRAANLKAIKHTNGSKAISAAVADSINTIERIIGNYRAARQIAYGTGYQGLAKARTLISKAQEYANDPWLARCTSLTSDLRNVASRLEQAHFNYLTAQVQTLNNYTSYSSEYYEGTVVKKVNDLLTEYEQNARSVYGTAHDISHLWQQSRDYYTNAASYYYEL